MNIEISTFKELKNELASRLACEIGGHRDKTRKGLEGKLFTFMESLGGSEVEIKARKDMVALIIKEVMTVHENNDHWMLLDLSQWLDWNKDPKQSKYDQPTRFSEVKL